MHRKAGTPIPAFPLPEGYAFSLFQDGDETDWARIETSVGEFDSEFNALMYFKKDYMPEVEQLRRRLLFIETADGFKVATANAWWSVITSKKHIWQRNAGVSDRRSWLHWVSVCPEYQGKGLGKAITSRALELMRELDGDTDMYLNTQTWSYKAIGIYKKCGFEPTDEKLLYKYGGKKKSEYKRALKILKGIENQRMQNEV